MPRFSGRRSGILLGVIVALLGVSGRHPGSASGTPSAQDGRQREFAVAARKYAFVPARIEVQQDDLVKITFTTIDIPHSFTIDRYRIAKRVSPGQTVVFEFRADQPGRFPIYCNLTIDERCREIQGELVVNPR